MFLLAQRSSLLDGPGTGIGLTTEDTESTEWVKNEVPLCTLRFSVRQTCGVVVFARMSFRGAERRGISSVGGAELAQACLRVEIPRRVWLRHRRNERNDRRPCTLHFDLCILHFDLRVLRALYFRLRTSAI